VASGLSSPGGLCAAENALYWLESSGSRPGALAYVPTAGPSLRLRARDGAGQIRTVGQWPAAAGPDALPESGDIVGVRAGEACVRVRRPVSTEFVRFRLPSGEAERVAFEPGRQQGLLYRERLYWTAPSDESASDAVSQVRRQADTGETETAAEWLPPGGALLALRGRAWYASLQLYRLPLKLAPAEIHGRLPFGRVRSDGARVVVLDGPGAPSAFPMEKE
jgi:hypothetical protein